MRRLPPACLAAMLLAATGASAIEEFPEQFLLPVDAGMPGSTTIPALVTLPPGWSAGDAVAILVARSAQHALREALLAQQAGVVELVAPDCNGASRLRAMSVVVRRDLGAGVMVAIGIGCAGRAVLQVARSGDAPLAAVVALDRSSMVFAAGPPPAAEEGWPLRAPILCALVASMVRDGAAAARADCQARLAAPH